jgi:hypothetical protein
LAFYQLTRTPHFYKIPVLGLRISRVGMIIAYPLLPARPHDSQLLDDLIAGFEGVVPAEKGFLLRTAGVIDLGEIRPLRANWKSDPALQTGGATDACAQ